MRKRGSQHHIDGLLALLLFGVFAVCVLAVLLTGADSYRRLTDRDQAAYERRTCTQYIATRVRQSDRAGAIRVEDFDGSAALVLDADLDYATWLYCRDGWLMELYCLAEERLKPEDGQQLMEAESMELTLEENLLSIRVVTSQGAEDTLLLSLRSGEGVDA